MNNVILNKIKKNPFIPLSKLKTKLSIVKEPACILIQGDSTSNDGTDWWYLAMTQLAQRYPGYTAYQRAWIDASQSYSFAYSPIQTGSKGLAYGLFTGENGSYVSCPDNANFHITGDLEISAKVALDDWTPANLTAIISKFEGVQKSYALYIGTTGKIILYWSEDGSANKSYSSTVAPTINNGQALWIRATLDVDNGAGNCEVKFYTSSNGFTWVQLGSTVVDTGTTSIFAGNTKVTIGGNQNGTGYKLAGKVYSVTIRNGIDGAIVASPDFGMAFPSTATTFNDINGNVWTVNGNATIGNGSPTILLLNGSVAGKAISYATDATRFAKMTAYKPDLAFINFSHNEGATVDYTSTYQGLINQVLTKWSTAGIICSTQNPETPPAANILPHRTRNDQIRALAIKNKYGLIDAYNAFIKKSNITDYMNADGIHPSAAGYVLWTDEAVKFLDL